MQHLTTTALLIFIKNPEKGKVKTRLAATMGEDKAFSIYKALMAHTRKVALSQPCKRMLFYSQSIAEQDDWSAQDFDKKLQTTGDLGHKMKIAFQTAFAEGSQKVVIIGSDCASLRAEIVAEAFAKLDEVDFVIGPTYDGGYYLLGMRQMQTALFENIPWSTDTVLEDTLKIIHDISGRYALLPKLSDIDYEEDWIRWGKDLQT
ncbi:MAG TPA: glycosyltransferase [Phaeodactylibacter sp.]|nr:glycosyltransferase [Phaeodactylibacter sp.]